MLQLGSGIVDNRDDIISDLETEVESLKAQLAHEKQAGREGARAVASLRKQLTPIYQALQQVFGHMEAIPGMDASSPTDHVHPARVSAAWEQWKQKLGKGGAKMIDALLIHGEMTRRQIAVATGYSPQNISNLTSELNKLSLITKNGDKIALRQL